MWKGSGLRRDFCQMVQVGLEDVALQRQVGELALSNDRNQAGRLQLFEVMRERGGAHGRDVDDWLQAERELWAMVVETSASGDQR